MERGRIAADGWRIWRLFRNDRPYFYVDAGITTGTIRRSARFNPGYRPGRDQVAVSVSVSVSVSVWCPGTVRAGAFCPRRNRMDYRRKTPCDFDVFLMDLAACAGHVCLLLLAVVGTVAWAATVCTPVSL